MEGYHCKMTATPFASIRRLISALLLLSFAFYAVEAAAADVHDQDPAAMQLASDHGPSTGNLPPQDPGGSNPPGDSHLFHLCHCSHSHAGVLPLIPDLTPTIVPAWELPWAGTSLLLSIQRTPPLRPPIA